MTPAGDERDPYGMTVPDARAGPEVWSGSFGGSGAAHGPVRVQGATVTGCGKIPFRSRGEAEKELRRIRLIVRGHRSAHKIPVRRGGVWGVASDRANLPPLIKPDLINGGG